MSPDDMAQMFEQVQGNNLVMTLAIVMFSVTKIVETLVNMRRNGSDAKPFSRLISDVGELKGKVQLIHSELEYIRGRLSKRRLSGE